MLVATLRAKRHAHMAVRQAIRQLKQQCESRMILSELHIPPQYHMKHPKCSQ